MYYSLLLLQIVQAADTLSISKDAVIGLLRGMLIVMSIYTVKSHNDGMIDSQYRCRGSVKGDAS